MSGDKKERDHVDNILQVVKEEYERQAQFGMRPSVVDYGFALETWLEDGLTPGQNHQERCTF